MLSWRRVLPFSLRVAVRQLHRDARDTLFPAPLAHRRDACGERFGLVVLSHRTPLRRSPGVDQDARAHNLSLAAPCFDGLVIGPGEVLSFGRTLGRAGRRQGYRDGLELRDGAVVRAPGGGLCAMANLLYWMGLHADLVVLERHRHGLDLFPERRPRDAVPFGAGVSVFGRYLDLRLRNPHPFPLRLGVRTDGPWLLGEVRAPEPLGFRVVVTALEERFVPGADGAVRREGALVRRVLAPDGALLRCEEVSRHSAKLAYPLLRPIPVAEGGAHVAC